MKYIRSIVFVIFFFNLNFTFSSQHINHETYDYSTNEDIHSSLNNVPHTGRYIFELSSKEQQEFISLIEKYENEIRKIHAKYDRKFSKLLTKKDYQYLFNSLLAKL